MQQQRRATFDTTELAVALSHYDLGAIESITEFNKGSRRSPKVGIVCERGKFLFKRLAPDRAEPDRVRFTHRLQTHLSDAGFPLARLIPTCNRNQKLLKIRDRAYELFEFIPGQRYGRTAPESLDAGVMLARFHKATDQLSADDLMSSIGPRGDYHDAPGVRTGLCSVSSTFTSHDSFTGDEAELAGLVQFLLDAYDGAAAAADKLKLAHWPERIIHSDWHPGNLVFKDGKVIAVVDYDAARYSKVAIDIANGVLQFSILGLGDPAGWPDELDEERFEAFLSGYESLLPLPEAQRQSLPHLMIEALIAECVHPIARTGAVGQWTGFRVLQMVRRKVTWLADNAGRLARSDRGEQ